MTGDARSSIIVDANVFLRFLVKSTSPDTQRQAEAAKHLFRLAANGDVTFTTNSAVVAEVVFILHSPRHYDLPRPEIAERLTRRVNIPACVVAEKRQIIAALNLWQGERGLSFVDCLAIEQSRVAHSPLASFDRRVQRVAGDLLWTDLGDR